LTSRWKFISKSSRLKLCTWSPSSRPKRLSLQCQLLVDNSGKTNKKNKSCNFLPFDCETPVPKTSEFTSKRLNLAQEYHLQNGLKLLRRKHCSPTPTVLLPELLFRCVSATDCDKEEERMSRKYFMQILFLLIITVGVSFFEEIAIMPW